MKITKNTTLNAQSMDPNGKAIAYFTASVPSDGGQSTANSSVSDQALYDANKAQVRKDWADFMAEVYKVEDATEAENTVDTTK